MAKHNHHIHSAGKRLSAAIILNFVTSIAEIIGGLISGSLSLISDALHNLSDGVSIIISYIAIRLKMKNNSLNHTFGLKRAEILAALLNASTLIAIYIFLLYEAVKRIYSVSYIEPGIMIIIAFIGLITNIIGTLLLKKGAKDSMNIRSSYMHLLSDAAASVGVLLGGIAIYYWKAYWIDPLLTIFIGIYIVKESFSILAEAVHILMEGAPLNVSIEDIQKEVEKFPEVEDIHHVHLWMVGENDIHIEAHINVNDMRISESDSLRLHIENALTDKFGIKHITLQFECNVCLKNGLLGGHQRDSDD